MDSTSVRNFKIFTTVSSIWAVVMGFIGPFYVVQVQKLSGGMERLGIAFAIMVFLQSISTYFAGRFSDGLGRRPFLIGVAYADAAILIGYTVIQDYHQLYLLQGLLGLTNGISGTIRVALLADLTTQAKRGRNIGKFHALVGLASAVGLSLGGYLAGIFGVEFLFYLASATVALSTTLLFFMKEKEYGSN